MWHPTPLMAMGGISLQFMQVSRRYHLHWRAPGGLPANASEGRAHGLSRALRAREQRAVSNGLTAGAPAALICFSHHRPLATTAAVARTRSAWQISLPTHLRCADRCFGRFFWPRFCSFGAQP